ncbi:MAG: phospholipase D-like domain-containing protein [Firmicutes bacterium]|nr:phospholipase D-like domain-containing protein [Bacillota bacterium]
MSTYQNHRDHRKIIAIDGRVAFTGGINIADEYVNRKMRFGHWKDNGIRVTGLAVNKLTAMFLEMWDTASSGATEYKDYVGISEYARGGKNGCVIPYGDSPLDDEKVGKRVYIDMINTAKDYVYIMTPYLILDSEMTEAMRYAVNRGVDVKIIIPHHPDKVYAYWLAHTYFPELIKNGVELYEYTPGFIHAKTVVSDDKKAVVGTINFDYRSLFLHYECAVYMYKIDAVFDIKSDFIATMDKSQHITEAEYKRFNPLTKLMGRLIRIVAPLL